MSRDVMWKAIGIIGCGCWLLTGAFVVADVIYPESAVLARHVLSASVFVVSGPVWVKWLVEDE